MLDTASLFGKATQIANEKFEGRFTVSKDAELWRCWFGEENSKHYVMTLSSGIDLTETLLKMLTNEGIRVYVSDRYHRPRKLAEAL